MLSRKRRMISCLFHTFRLEQLWDSNLYKGLIGEDVFKSVDDYVIDESYWITDTNNRGPWMVEMENFKRFGLLNSKEYFLGFDDHEFNFRCSLDGFKSGYTTVKIFSNVEDGSTRQIRSGQNLEIWSEMSSIKLGARNFREKISGLVSTTPFQVFYN